LEDFLSWYVEVSTRLRPGFVDKLKTRLRHQLVAYESWTLSAYTPRHWHKSVQFPRDGYWFHFLVIVSKTFCRKLIARIGPGIYDFARDSYVRTQAVLVRTAANIKTWLLCVRMQLPWNCDFHAPLLSHFTPTVGLPKKFHQSHYVHISTISKPEKKILTADRPASIFSANQQSLALYSFIIFTQVTSHTRGTIHWVASLPGSRCCAYTRRLHTL